MKKILAVLLALAFSAIIIIPRFSSLATLPPGLHIDEVSFAADAKSIAETGRDTWGERYPLIFKAFGEWKAPGLVYSMAFWAKVFDRMDNGIARLPSAIAGLTTLIFLGLTLKQLFTSSKSFFAICLTVFILAFSPWHFDMSRIFYEAFSALSLISISLYFLTKAMLSPHSKLSFWVYAAIFASLAGYWYASIRYVVILGMLFALLIQPWTLKVKIKKSLLILLVILGVGLGWVGDLVSDKGLNRLYYYQTKSKEGATLEIDEKRQYCYLSFDRDSAKAKNCYYVWNKPIHKVVSAIKIYYAYLGTDFLFVSAMSEYGFDSEYGAYLLPILPIYLVGLYFVLRGLVSFFNSLFVKKYPTTPTDRLYTFFVGFAFLSLLPAAIANNLNMRMGLIALYIVAIVIGIGAKEIITWVNTKLSKYRFLFYLGYGSIILFFIIQSLMHYFLVFTRSNDLMWTSDAGSIFGYVTSVSSQYDRIVDAELHGPLAPYFYGDITTEEIQSGTYSPPDQFGFTYLTKAGKYELRHVNIRDLACEKLSQNDQRKVLVITSPQQELTSIRKFAGTSWSGALLLHEVYDVDDIIANELKSNESFIARCQPK